ncbi:molybdopterin-binding protein [Kocuria tytonicola]|uniref:molybdopterin-binding protein n=1 Tax=Kocuria tytonicola TaxID=2055946 RepID=UPI001F0BC365|nr:molybdopterin-binding protein [Kocuria tytonicola]
MPSDRSSPELQPPECVAAEQSSREPSPRWSRALTALHHADRRAARALAHAAGAALARTRAEAACESVPLAEAPGRVLARDAHAACPIPHYASSAMDGWAVRGPGPWRPLSPRHDDALPSTASDVALEPGTAVPVVTGGVVPAGATTVVRDEYSRVDGVTLDLAPGAPQTELAGRHLRPAGTECATGDLLLAAGDTVSPVDAALAAVAGLDSLQVRTPPRVAVLLTGSEVLSAGVPGPGRVRDAFSMSLPHIATAYGARVGTVQRVPDDPEQLAAAFDAACADHDLVLTTGGTSRSAADHVRPLVHARTRVLVDQLGLQPGHPALLGAGERAAVLALPGNPLGAVVVLLLLGGGFLAGFLGREPQPFPPAVTGVDVPGGRSDRLVPARRREGAWVPCRSVGSNMLSGLAAADGLLAVPRGGLAAGGAAEILALPW